VTLARRTGEAGYTLVEMLSVLVIMSVVLAALTTLFVQGSNAETDMNVRFRAQTSARLALDKLRRQVHCVNSITNATSSFVTLNGSTGCVPTGQVSWCTSGSGTRYALYFQTGTTCTSASTRYVDYLTSGSVFTYVDSSTTSLSQLHVVLPVNTKPSRSVDGYTLCDNVVLRNSSRTGSGTAPPACPT